MTIGQLVPGFRPETTLERALAADPVLLCGLAWGQPRPGHPEGRVGVHVRDILAAIGEPAGGRRRQLRFLALVHDALKHRVRPGVGRTPDNDHAVLARRFAERYTDDPRLLAALELHDEPYRIWRSGTHEARAALETVLGSVPDRGLFLRFVELDGSTNGKDPRPMAWVRDVAGVPAPTHLALAA
jgi:hypothetical protein